MPRIEPTFTWGSITTLLSVLISAGMLCWQIQVGLTEKTHQMNEENQRVSINSVEEAKSQEDLKNALTALAERMGDMSDRVHTIADGNTQRFTAVDTGIKEMVSRLDSLTTSLQSISDRATILEAKAQAMQHEIEMQQPSYSNSRRTNPN